ncbi:MAG: Tat pathway signal sequence, partial [Lachnospiraceae bacterium]|nr:Tat pathway signal sequence [Lachnospiraceae bacterium]
MSQKTKRILMAFFGVIVTGFCVGTFQKASLGTDPFTCFVTGIGNIFGSTYSTFYVIVTGALLIGVFLVEKHYIGIATVINLFGTGISADLMRNLWDVLVPNPGMGVRAMLVVLGVVGSCFSASMYFTADLGVSAYDAISLIAANKYKLMAFRVCRVLSDLICVTVGVIFHANVGIGT